MSATLGACGGGGNEPVDPNQPIEGREIRKAKELEGVWLALNEGSFLGIEFMDDGRAIGTLYSSAFESITPAMFDYSLLHGGRLALVGANGVGQEVYTTIIDGDQLELKGFVNSQRFMRLPKGQTLEQGIEAQSKLREAEYEKRYKVVNEMLRQDDLVIVPITPSPNAPPAMALQLAETGSGQAWYEADPPHLDAIDTQIDADRSNQPSVQLSFGRQIRPATSQQSGGGSITFVASGDWENPTLTSQVDYDGQTLDLALRRDRSRHAAIVEQFDAEMARIDALRKPVTDLLKEVAVLDVSLSSDNPGYYPKGYLDHLVLTLDADTGMYSGGSVVTTLDSGAEVQFPSISGEVALSGNGIPLLIIRTPVRQYQLTPDGNKFTGAWFHNNYQDGYAAEASIVSAGDAATLKQQNDVQREALMALDGSVAFFGFVNHMPTFDHGATALTRLTVTPRPDGTFSAEARFPVIDGTERMTGTIVDVLDEGPMLELRFADFSIAGQPNNFGNPLRNQVWMLKVTETSPGNRKLSGYGINLGPGELEFKEMSDKWRDEQKRAVISTLSAGADFAWLIPADEGAITHLRLDPASSNVTGQLAAGGRATAGYVGIPYEGERIEVDGFPVVTANFKSDANARYSADQSLTWFALQTPDGVLLKGRAINNQNTYTNQSEMLAARRD
jgi:hypothetical protein